MPTINSLTAHNRRPNCPILALYPLICILTARYWRFNCSSLGFNRSVGVFTAHNWRFKRPIFVGANLKFLIDKLATTVWLR